MSTILVGLGNELLGDDGVGPYVARAVAAGLSPDTEVRVEVAGVGGLRLAERLSGYERALVVDALVAPSIAIGSVVEFGLAEGRATHGLDCSHDGDLGSALGALAALGAAVPREVRVLGIVVGEVEEFSLVLGPAVQVAADSLAKRLTRELSESIP